MNIEEIMGPKTHEAKTKNYYYPFSYLACSFNNINHIIARNIVLL